MPTTAPARDAAADGRAAVEVARRFASAVAAGNLAAAGAMIHAPTKAHALLADVVARQFVAYHRVRAAAVKPLGLVEARRLPFNDAGTFFQYRMSPRIDGDIAVVAWRDEYGQDGTEREIELVRVDGAWRISTVSFASGGSAAEVYRAVGEANWFLRRLDEAAAEIEAGKLTTFEQINEAI